MMQLVSFLDSSALSQQFVGFESKPFSVAFMFSRIAIQPV